MATYDDQEEGHVYPAEESKLPPQLVPLEVCDEANKAECIKHKGDEAVVSREWNEICVHKDNVL